MCNFIFNKVYNIDYEKDFRFYFREKTIKRIQL